MRYLGDRNLILRYRDGRDLVRKRRRISKPTEQKKGRIHPNNIPLSPLVDLKAGRFDRRGIICRISKEIFTYPHQSAFRGGISPLTISHAHRGTIGSPRWNSRVKTDLIRSKYNSGVPHRRPRKELGKWRRQLDRRHREKDVQKDMFPFRRSE